MPLTLQVPDAPGSGFTVNGSGFPPGAFVWITVQDLTDENQPVDGPEAFQTSPDGTFTHAGPTSLACGHCLQARAFVQGQIFATSPIVTPRCQPKPLPAGLADPRAGSAAQAAYAGLLSAPDRVDHRLIIGQALRGWDHTKSLDEPITALIMRGLPAPKLLEVELTDFGVTASRDEELSSLLLGHAAAGGFIGFSWHAGNPNTGGDVNDRSNLDLLPLQMPEEPHTTAGTRWRDELDRVVGVMQPFLAAGAVVFFRPLHESNGEWFWWGQADPADFASVWNGMFRYLTGSKGLHDLLWVYSANRNHEGSASSDPTRYYPGDDFVDLVALDIYDDDLADAPPCKPGYEAMLRLGKPFAISEYGAQNDPLHDGAAHLPNSRVIQLIKDRYSRCVLATAWYSTNGNNWQISDKPDTEALLLDPWAVTR